MQGRTRESIARAADVSDGVFAMSETPIARQVVEQIRRQLRAKVADLTAFREGKAVAAELQASAYATGKQRELHPAHAIYAQVQNQMSRMAEPLLELAQMKSIAKILSTAQDAYMPSWPPMSPITTSFFWCWANFDAAANSHRETLGSVILAVATELDADPTLLALMRALIFSRMGIYRVEPDGNARVRLTDIVTGRQCPAISDSGYTGKKGELWFTRVLPPASTEQSDHFVFTSPYVLLSPDAEEWQQYFDRIAGKDAGKPRMETIERHFKWGASRRYWPEFVFEGYVNHVPGAIFLKGFPDVAASRPHSRQYVRLTDED